MGHARAMGAGPRASPISSGARRLLRAASLPAPAPRLGAFMRPRRAQRPAPAAAAAAAPPPPASAGAAPPPPRRKPGGAKPDATVAPGAAAYTSLPSPAGFAAPGASSFAVAILGDLHLPQDARAPENAEFEAARGHLQAAMAGADAQRVAQLGDLGSYEPGWPGSAECFARAAAYLDSFGVPRAAITGNHDLEGAAFATDAANLEAWHAGLGQRHYWSADLGPSATMVGLSTTRFRSNAHSVHEVHVDAEQLRFLRAAVEAAEDEGRAVVVLTHAPPAGSGLRAVQAVHVRNRCAWINHSSDPRALTDFVAAHPCIRLWFSGHFHLSQNFRDAVALFGKTAFVLAGCIGSGSARGGQRGSRVLRGDGATFEVLSVDHATGRARVDLTGRWDGADGAPAYVVPPSELLPDDGAAGFMTSSASAPPADRAVWLNCGPQAMLALQRDTGLVVEYDTVTMAPMGVAAADVPRSATVALVDASGGDVDAVGTDGGAAAALEVRDGERLLQRVPRNADGGFSQIFQPNKWVARQRREAAEAAAAARAAAGAAGAAGGEAGSTSGSDDEGPPPAPRAPAAAPAAPAELREEAAAISSSIDELLASIGGGGGGKKAGVSAGARSGSARG